MVKNGGSKPASTGLSALFANRDNAAPNTPTEMFNHCQALVKCVGVSPPPRQRNFTPETMLAVVRTDVRHEGTSVFVCAATHRIFVSQTMKCVNCSVRVFLKILAAKCGQASRLCLAFESILHVDGSRAFYLR